jgi:hypothetical protein
MATLQSSFLLSFVSRKAKHMKFIHRAHELLADKISWVQYPNIRETRRQPKPDFFAHKMPIETRIGLAVFGLLTIAISLGMLTVLGFLAWVMFFV